MNTLPGLPTRLDFAQFCNVRGYKWAVEIGTDRGIFARDFLDRWVGEQLWCVDPYEPCADMPWSRSADLQFAVSNLLPHARRCHLLLYTSQQAAVYFTKSNISVDFAYLDGAHDQDNVERDLFLWYSRLRPGGVLAGDDWSDTEHCPDVQPAVKRFAEINGLTIYLTQDYNRAQSWYVEKPK